MSHPGGSARIDRFRALAAIENGSVVVVSSASDIRWLIGFSGSNGAILLTRTDTILFTDGRYSAQVERECPGMTTRIGTGTAFSQVVEALKDTVFDTVFLQADHVSWTDHSALVSSNPDVSVESLDHQLRELRAEKDEGEVDAIRRALGITERVFQQLPALIKEGVSENELAAEIDYRQRQEGASASSFDTIVAFGDHSALPHARPGNRTLAHGDPILIDFGCVVDGYCSDMTRMMSFGRPSDELKRTCERVLEAMRAAIAVTHAGVSGARIDAEARDLLDQDGLASFFTHSLGHGVGLDIHEWPTLSSRGVDPLPPNGVVTVEPGVYRPGEFGVRIENMILVRESDALELNASDPSLLIL